MAFYECAAPGKLAYFLKKNAVTVVAFAGAVITSFIIPPDKSYSGYIDFKTLTCLFCVLAVVCALRNINFFYNLALNIVKKFKSVRHCVLALVYVTFIGSMLIANDMALLTFLPLGYYVLHVTDKEKYMSFTFIMQNIAANLGGMLTPFGNPQNLYLYSKFNIPSVEFMSIMLFPFLLSVFMITVCCFIFVKNEKLDIISSPAESDKKRTAIYLALFLFAIVIVFRGIPYITGLIVIPAFLMFLDKKALKDVDYPLLLTFVFFFIFAGNMGRIPAVRDFLSGLLNKNTLLVSVLSCQVISNVPSAVLLSQFTENYPDLLVGVNIGGTGTLIASLASLITFREYVRHNPGKTIKYILEFSAFNFGFLVILTVIMNYIL